MIMKNTWKALLIIFLTYSVTFMCYPSIIFMYFTLLGYYKQQIESYDHFHGLDGNKLLRDAAKDYLVIYALLIVFTADLFATFIQKCIPECFLKFIMTPVLILSRIAIAVFMYATLQNDDKNLKFQKIERNYQTNNWPPYIYKALRNEDILMLAVLGFSHGLLTTRYLSKKPQNSEVYLQY